MQWEAVDGIATVKCGAKTLCLSGMFTACLRNKLSRFWGLCFTGTDVLFLEKRERSRLLMMVLLHTSCEQSRFQSCRAEHGKAACCPGVELKRMPRTSRLGYLVAVLSGSPCLVDHRAYWIIALSGSPCLVDHQDV